MWGDSMTGERLTYKQKFGDYGSCGNFRSLWDEVHALRNRLGKYEDADWKPVSKYGYPTKDDIYRVTVEDTEDKRRYTLFSLYEKERGFNAEEYIFFRVIAWKEKDEPYEGD